MKTIQILQNKLMWILLKLDRLTPTKYLHKMLNICQVNDIYVCCLSNFVNDVLCGRCPDIFKNYFEFRRIFYDVRRKWPVKIPAARLLFGGKTARIHGASLWNKLHTSVVPFQLKKSFKKVVKIFLISKYSYTHTHGYYEKGTHGKPINLVFYCCHMLLVASLMSICFPGNHRQYCIFI